MLFPDDLNTMLNDERQRGIAEGLRTIQNHPPVPDDFMRPRQAARYLKVCLRTLTNWRRRGYVAHHRVGRVVVYARADLDTMMKKFRIGANRNL
jgi:excisionase family DNA binding protein